MSDEDLEPVERADRSAVMATSECVRRALEKREQNSARADRDDKLLAIRRSLQHEFPAPEIDVMLAEIDGGRRNAWTR